MLTVQVELPNRAKPITCATKIADLELGDRCLLEVEGKTRFGTVVRIPLDLNWGDSGPGAHIIRRASKSDEERQLLIESRKEECIKTARELAAEYDLPMKILRADVPANVNKATIFFVAEGRVDFRQMVRELVKKLRMRVELRQIGARDAAAIQGGVGHCGEQLCCARWLTAFAPVSMKMAKKQGLPLNPSKISGQCGRLMCCLRYELKDADLKKKKKKIVTELPCARRDGAAAGDGANKPADKPRGERRNRRSRRGRGNPDQRTQNPETQNPDTQISDTQISETQNPESQGPESQSQQPDNPRTDSPRSSEPAAPRDPEATNGDSSNRSD